MKRHISFHWIFRINRIVECCRKQNCTCKQPCTFKQAANAAKLIDEVVTRVPNALILVLPTTVTSSRLSVHRARCRCSFKMAAPVGRW
jgi:hypothetical protein